MPEFVLDTSGRVRAPSARVLWGSPMLPTHLTWGSLDAFTQGYIEAMFFTENAPGVTTEEWQATEGHDEGSIPGDVGFSDLAPETLARIIEDCAKFQATDAWKMTDAALDSGEAVGVHTGDMQAGRDFWYTRNGHGVGFWDGDWPEPYATALTEAAEAFGSVDAYLGDDGKVYLG